MFYLGVASNGDYMQFLLIDSGGCIHTLQNEKSIDLIHDGILEFRGAIESGVARTCLKAGIAFVDIDFAFFAIPSYGENKEFDNQLNEVLSLIFTDNNYICENDIEAAWAGALAGREGIVLLAGVGSIAIGKNYKGESQRVSGWGRLSGDEGGEYWLAKKVLETFTKEADGRFEGRILYRLLKERTLLKRDYDIIDFTFDDLQNTEITFYEFVDILFDSAKLGDLNAQEVIKQSAYEFYLMVKSILHKVEFDSTVCISYTGRIFRDEYLIINHLKEYLQTIKGYEYLFLSPQLSLVSGAALQALNFKERITEYIVSRLSEEEKRIEETSKLFLHIHN